MILDAVEIKASLPAFDFDASRAFSKALGFVMYWSPDVLACFRHDTPSA